MQIGLGFSMLEHLPSRPTTAAMATRKRKTLPKDFDQLLESASLAELIAVFDTCQLDATGGYSKRTALGFYNCPDALVRWLVAQGADIDARDEHLGTALHCRSSSWMGGVDLLLDLGADIEARDRRGNTPLHAAIQSHKAESVAALVRRGADTRAPGRNGESIMHLALATTANGDIVEMAQIARILLDAGVPIDDEDRAEVRRIGLAFEFHRAGFNPESVPATDAALATLYRLFDVPPVPARLVHDGKSAITVTATDWPAQHQQLWELLVPSAGAAKTVQGEVIRLTGRLANEINGNGAANWCADFKKMLGALVGHLGSPMPLPEHSVAEAERLATALKGGDDPGGYCDRLCELAVEWVIANPQPVALGKPAYRR